MTNTLLAGWDDCGAPGGDQRGGGPDDDQARGVQLAGHQGQAQKEVRIQYEVTLFTNHVHVCTGFWSEIGTKLRDWAFGQAGGSCYSWAALSSNDSKTR